MLSLKDFYTTNRAPNDEEKGTIKQFVAKYDDKLATISNKIRDLEAQLRALNHEKVALHSKDVIREIFTACLPTGRNPTMSNTEAPVLLTQISSATRRIALTTPALWAAIHITFNISSGWLMRDCATSIMAARAKGVEEWLLRRSGSLPLYISVHHPQTAHKDQDLGQQIIDILLSCCSRWSHVSFKRLPKILLRISTLTDLDVPILNSLSISDYPYERHDELWKSSLILKAPTLQRLSISRMPMELDYLPTWSNLTHIGFSRTFYGPVLMFLDTTASILRQTTRLISCCLFVPGDVQLSTPDEISLPFLKSLIVSHRANMDFDSDSDSDSVGGILASINAPALEALQYNTNGGIDVTPEDLITLLTRASNLQELYMENCYKPRILAECLRYCPSITRLRISLPSGEKYFVKNNALIEAFVLDDVTQCLCPQLKYFHCDDYFSLSLRTLHKFITQKNGLNQSLGRWNTLVLKVTYHPADELLQHFGKLTSLRNVTGETKISLQFTKWTQPYSSLDQGLDKPETPEDVWWQCQSKLVLNI